MLIIGPIIFGLILGLVLGTQIKSSSEFSLSSFIIIIIAGIIVAWQLGPFPFYGDLPVSTAFISALIGIIVGKFLLGRRSVN
jgi:hypothetical protein